MRIARIVTSGVWAEQKNCKPLMCAYKLVTANFDYFGLRSKVEEYCINYEKNLFLASHKQVRCGRG